MRRPTTRGGSGRLRLRGRQIRCDGRRPAPAALHTWVRNRLQQRRTCASGSRPAAPPIPASMRSRLALLAAAPCRPSPRACSSNGLSAHARSPRAGYDLILLSEILYFLDADGDRRLSLEQIDAALASGADIVGGDVAGVVRPHALRRRMLALDGVKRARPPSAREVPPNGCGSAPPHRSVHAPLVRSRRYDHVVPPVRRNGAPSGFVVAIPARDEAARLPTALRSMAQDGVVRDVIVIANGCTDRTMKLAVTGHPGLRVAVLETGPLPGGVGEARRLGMAAALDAAPDIDRSWPPPMPIAGSDPTGARSRARRWRGPTSSAAASSRSPPSSPACRSLVRRHGAMEDHAAAARGGA